MVLLMLPPSFTYSKETKTWRRGKKIESLNDNVALHLFLQLQLLIGGATSLAWCTQGVLWQLKVCRMHVHVCRLVTNNVSTAPLVLLALPLRSVWAFLQIVSYNPNRRCTSAALTCQFPVLPKMHKGTRRMIHSLMQMNSEWWQLVIIRMSFFCDQAGNMHLPPSKDLPRHYWMHFSQKIRSSRLRLGPKDM